MLVEGLRGYLQLARGLTDVTKERARSVARSLLNQGESGVESLSGPLKAQVIALADDLVAQAKTNRDLLRGLVRTEAERAVGRAGLSFNSELAAATRRSEALEDRVEELERELRSARADLSPPVKSAGTKKATKEATKTTAKKATGTKTATTKAPAKKASAKKASAKKAPAKSTAPSAAAPQPSPAPAPANATGAPPESASPDVWSDPSVLTAPADEPTSPVDNGDSSQPPAQGEDRE